MTMVRSSEDGITPCRVIVGGGAMCCGVDVGNFLFKTLQEVEIHNPHFDPEVSQWLSEVVLEAFSTPEKYICTTHPNKNTRQLMEKQNLHRRTNRTNTQDFQVVGFKVVVVVVIVVVIVIVQASTWDCAGVGWS